MSNTGLTDLFVNAVAVDPMTPTTLYAGASGVFKSADGGGSWTASNSGLTYTSSMRWRWTPRRPRPCTRGPRAAACSRAPIVAGAGRR